ncbi:4-substituted benzoates-glutamate ligase GH3.12-like [Arabidopsis lyrata subsp. lyrata]|uniref:4-substituted benzoates-glutamate ligase GH3.12-like n=1 Tax=Arabidopsis lyrata subsp. lyrata TaxID=81972 RepID=UPI000A29B521|nr:4-substituted benzoates-glutamate ligase GH3.12-like [Arabidopsis lyrata subsp. lyrata]|eukprot:XP_020869371.1 4-substituted benzoates-glutamate ligase GH3.12-like [Arabidopsis lyrata subsp. lyrata]
MSLSSDLKESNLDEMKNVLEDLTSNVKQVQDGLLEEILAHSADTEYLQRFLHGMSTKELFKKNVPIVTYKDVEPYIEHGEPSNIISAHPITRFTFSSGTSGRKQKLMPFNMKYLENIIYSIGIYTLSLYADISTVPGHYVLYWELKAENKNTILELGEKLLMECCYTVEEAFNFLYRKFRCKDGLIGALEIRVVQPGTFDSLMNYFISEGSSLIQYKTPIMHDICPCLSHS